MGKKTDKKVKPDRINVLRKQYDAFLEEDKKRKDRNEYILGRLDKMRYTSAVQVRHQPKIYGEYIPASYNRHAYRPENVERNDMQIVPKNQQFMRPGYQSLQLDVPRKYMEETSILNEISKKYILIPKLRTSFPDDAPEVIPPTIPAPVSSVNAKDIENSDWKSKYDILEQLKKKENEEQINKYANNCDEMNNKEPTQRIHVDRANDSDIVMKHVMREDLPTRFVEEIPEKDLSNQLAIENELKTLEKCRISENIEQLPVTDTGYNTSSFSLNPEIAASYDQIQNKVYDQHEVDENVDNSQPEQYVMPAEQNVVAASDTDDNRVEYQENYPEQEYPIEYEQFIPNNEANPNQTELESVINQEENDYSPIEVINPSELVDEINNEIVLQEAIKTEQEYPSEIGNIQEYNPGDAVGPEFATNEAFVLQDGIGIDPHNYMTDDGTVVQGNPVPQMLTEDPTDKGIEEFDAENREMFYSDNANTNYTYEQGAGDQYNAEYAQNQNYPQTQEYAYYEGAAQAEETYPVEINEHEETQQPYDQQYEQQYATNYEPGYEQQTVYMEQDATQKQYEQPELYDQAHQEFEQEVYNQLPADTQEQVEQALDQEDGYIKKRADPVEDKKADFNIS